MASHRLNTLTQKDCVLAYVVVHLCSIAIHEMINFVVSVTVDISTESIVFSQKTIKIIQMALDP